MHLAAPAAPLAACRSGRRSLRCRAAAGPSDAEPPRRSYAPKPLPADFGEAFTTDAGASGAPSVSAPRPAPRPAVVPDAAPPKASPFGATAKPASPFGAVAKPATPFGATSAAVPPPAAPLSPFAAAAAAPRPRAPPPEPARSGLPQLTLAQVIITVSFVTITVLMLSTFYVVLQSGGIRFNTD